MPWANASVAHLLLVCRMMAVEVGDGIAEESSSDDYDQVMFIQNAETIEAFSSQMVLVKAGKAYTWQCINIMVQALQTKDSSLLQGLAVQNTYTELRQGSKRAVVAVRNSRLTHRPSGRKPQWPGQWQCSQYLNHPRRLSCRRRVMSPKILIPPNWLSGWGMGNCSMNWIWVGWILGLQSWWTLPAGSWPSTTMCFCLILWNWAVPMPPNTW